MTQVKKYRIGTYQRINGKLVLENHNRTYRRKATKFQKNKSMKEAKSTLTVLFIALLLGIIIGQKNEISIAPLQSEFVIEEVSEVAMASEIEEPVVEAQVPQASYDGIPYMSKESIGVMEISHYSELDSCHYPAKGGCLTASGKIAEVGMVATNLYPFGTRLLIDGKEYVVEDRISKRYNNRIDIFTGYGEAGHQEAIKRGIQHLEVSLIN